MHDHSAPCCPLPQLLILTTGLFQRVSSFCLWGYFTLLLFSFLFFPSTALFLMVDSHPHSPSIHSFIHPSTHQSSIHPSIYPIIIHPSAIYSFTHSFIHHPFIHPSRENPINTSVLSLYIYICVCYIFLYYKYKYSKYIYVITLLLLSLIIYLTFYDYYFLYIYRNYTVKNSLNGPYIREAAAAAAATYWPCSDRCHLWPFRSTWMK